MKTAHAPVGEAGLATPTTSSVEHLGIDRVPPAQRTSTATDQFWIWAGANLAPINWVLGTLGLGLGLSLWETIGVLVVGNAVGASLFALFCVMGQRTGVNAMVLARLAMGRRGAYVVAAVMVLMPMGWVGVNTWVVLDLAVAAMDRLGFDADAGPLRYAIAGVIVVIQVVITAWGFNAIRLFERWTMPVVLAVMLMMTVVSAFHVNGSFAPSALSLTDKVSAASTVMTAIGIGWGITWFVYAADYTRFTRPEVSTRRLFGVTFAGMFVPVVWLGILGAYIASAGGGVDPAQLVIAAFGALALPVLLLILHGPIATNIVVMYSSVLAVLSLDLKATQWKIAAGGGVVSSIVLWGFLHSASFANSAAAWMSALVVWISPWAAITLIDFFVLRRGAVDVDHLYRSPSSRWTADVDWTAMACLAVGLVGGAMFMTTAIEGVQGPLAVAIGHVDLSWLVGSLAAGIPYYLLKRSRNRMSHNG
ncbi:cytosine permease [Mycolicibacterium sp.]|uniref:purine-cytosine permease family protein n=1 Tax=Mycolicibacterium sp. TaxID=2320850 RepID=UPI001A361F90|nr:cytosine permease [Mycolicibacterium sp.]MBJ7341271.1 cytosine permease [Mycolicibacterium sp.]